MATYDNKHWLLSHIRNSFISTDDTRMCEIVLAGENFPKLLHNRAQQYRENLIAKEKEKISVGKEGEEIANEWREPVTEYDPYPDLEESVDDLYILNGSYIRHEDFGHYRQRSNTAQWLEKKEQAMKKAAKVKVIKWENPQTNLTHEEREGIFIEKEIVLDESSKETRGKSLLAETLEQCPHFPHQQYLEYAKFDGTAQHIPTKTFKIFMTMLPEEQQNYPLTVTVIASAKIHDVIGFICFKYSVLHPDANLGPVSNYVLCIAEDDGEVDWTLPCIESNDPCSKFGFTCFGLVELKTKSAHCQVTGSIPVDGALNNAALNNAFMNIFAKHGEGGFNRGGDSRNTTGGSGTYDAAIRALNEEKKASASSPQDQDLDKINSHILASEAPQYKSYNVEISNKVRANTSVQLGISLERVEIEPVFSASNKFWPKKKYVSYNIESVAWCQIVETKVNKTVFKLVHAGNSSSTTSTPKATGLAGLTQHGANYKHHYFECDHETAKEIVEKINRILNLRNSTCYRDYKSARERKLQTRKSFHATKP